MAEAACAETAESSFDVTLPAPPLAAETRFESALMTACNPTAVPAPETVETLLMAERLLLTVDWRLTMLRDMAASAAERTLAS